MEKTTPPLKNIYLSLALSFAWITFLACFSADSWTPPGKRPLLFSLERSYLLLLEYSLLVLFTLSWKFPQHSFSFYLPLLPLRLLSATPSFVPLTTLLQAELFLLLGASLPHFPNLQQHLPKILPALWLTFLLPLLLSFLGAECFATPNRWFLYSPLLWFPEQLHLLP
jgi:hypothetical protein